MFKESSLIATLIIVAFLASTLGSLTGCVWCDHGSLSRIHLSSHLDDHTDHHQDIHPEDFVDLHYVITLGESVYSLDQHGGTPNDKCTDAPIQLTDSLVDGTNCQVKNAPPSLDMLSKADPAYFPIDSFETCNIPLIPLRTSPIILALQTVILLT